LTLWCFDPSTKSTGIALFDASGLVQVQVVEAKGVDGMINALRGVIKPRPGDEAVIETPMNYRYDKAPPSTVRKLVIVAGACRLPFTTSSSVTPREWNGGVPKKITHGRIEPLLSSRELAMVRQIRAAIRENAYDAVGVGLWKLGLLGR